MAVLACTAMAAAASPETMEYELTVVLRKDSKQNAVFSPDEPFSPPDISCFDKKGNQEISTTLSDLDTIFAKQIGIPIKIYKDPKIPAEFLDKIIGNSLKASLSDRKSDGRVLVDIDAAFIDLDGFIEYNTIKGDLIVPSSFHKGVKTRLRMTPGETVLLGRIVLPAISFGKEKQKNIIDCYTLMGRLVRKDAVVAPPPIEKSRYELIIQQCVVEGKPTESPMSTELLQEKNARFVSQTSLTVEYGEKGKIFSTQEIPYVDPQTEKTEPKFLDRSVGIELEVTGNSPENVPVFDAVVKFSKKEMAEFNEPAQEEIDLENIKISMEPGMSAILPGTAQTVVKDGKESTETTYLIFILKELSSPKK